MADLGIEKSDFQFYLKLTTFWRKSVCRLTGDVNFWKDSKHDLDSSETK